VIAFVFEAAPYGLAGGLAMVVLGVLGIALSRQRM
jgi:hypothetical protein